MSATGGHLHAPARASEHGWVREGRAWHEGWRDRRGVERDLVAQSVRLHEAPAFGSLVRVPVAVAGQASTEPGGPRGADGLTVDDPLARRWGGRRADDCSSAYRAVRHRVRDAHCQFGSSGAGPSRGGTRTWSTRPSTTRTLTWNTCCAPSSELSSSAFAARPGPRSGGRNRTSPRHSLRFRGAAGTVSFSICRRNRRRSTTRCMRARPPRSWPSPSGWTSCGRCWRRRRGLADELAASCARAAAGARGGREGEAFLLRVGRELAVLLRDDYDRLTAVLRRLRPTETRG